MSLKLRTIFKPAALAGLLGLSAVAQADTSESMVDLGRFLFNNTQLSKPVGQACASCHDAATGFTSPRRVINARGAVIHGAVRRRAGNRKPPSNAYVTYTEALAIDRRGNFTGGTFWDGRATGEVITDAIFPDSWDAETVETMSALLGPAADQAMGPFLNDVEQNLNNTKQLCRRVKQTMPKGMWKKAWGEALRCNDSSTHDMIHQRIGFAIAAYEHSDEVSPFNSFFDIAAAVTNKDENGDFTEKLVGFSESEQTGFEIYEDRCSFCHGGDVVHNGETKNLFARPAARYFNLGVPRNDQNPFYKMDTVKNDSGDYINPLGGAWVDQGMAARGGVFIDEQGKMKAPTLRNVAKKPNARFIKAFMHNGYFKSLETLVHFYNTRDIKPSCEAMLGLEYDPTNPMVVSDAEAVLFDCWPAAEVAANMSGCDDGENCKVLLDEENGETFDSYCDNPDNERGLGNFCLSEAEETALVDFMKTLSDM